MHPAIYIVTIICYFGALIIISLITSKKADNNTFFIANHKSPWFLVAFGMVGASLSGVTFISVPGAVTSVQFSFLQVVMGYVVGYMIIAFVFLPLYYRMNLVSIYGYLDKRFGINSCKTGSFFFILSQMMGASFRLFLAAAVLQLCVFDALGIPFSVCVLVTILLIWLYTFKGGIKTIVWTDAIQTAAMLASLFITIYMIKDHLNFTFSEMCSAVYQSPISQVFHWDWKSSHFFVKDFLAGIFIILAMTGIDQNMMQKNLTCKSLRDAQKNVIVMTAIYLSITFMFLVLGALIYIYMEKMGIAIPAMTDNSFPTVAMNHLGLFAGIVFFIGVIAAAFSSADSALAALTTAFCYDFINIEHKKKNIQKRIRMSVHIAFSIIMYIVIVIFHIINDKDVITAVFVVAGYTYGPLLGLFIYGICTKLQIRDQWVPSIAILSPVITYIFNINSEAWFWGYKFGFELLILNAFITIIGLMIVTKWTKKDLA
jgi:Na+/proline symporter